MLEQLDTQRPKKKKKEDPEPKPVYYIQKLIPNGSWV